MLLDPPKKFASIPLRLARLAPSRLYRITSFSNGEPHFGRSASNRFDDPTRAKLKRFGTCYFGESMNVALAETVLHDEMPVNGRFNLAPSELERRSCVRLFGGTLLTLADLTGTALKSLAGSSEMTTVLSYDIPQRWSRAIHNHPTGVDGLLYMSRHVNDKRAVVVFERAAHKLGTASYKPLPKVSGALAAVIDLRISFKFV